MFCLLCKLGLPFLSFYAAVSKAFPHSLTIVCQDWQISVLSASILLMFHRLHEVFRNDSAYPLILFQSDSPEMEHHYSYFGVDVIGHQEASPCWRQHAKRLGWPGDVSHRDMGRALRPSWPHMGANVVTTLSILCFSSRRAARMRCCCPR